MCTKIPTTIWRRIPPLSTKGLGGRGRGSICFMSTLPTPEIPPTWRRMPPLPTTKDILRLYRIKAKKSLSQNFIMDPRILQKFVKTAGNIEGKIAIEVGPGPGGITRAILDTKIRECHVIEKDPRFLPSLNLIKNAVGPEKLHISIGDCLHYNITGRLESKVNKTAWDSHLKSNLVLFGNLPFNIATPFLIKLMKSMADQTHLFSFGRMTSILTFQHEVALRMVAPPNNPERCRLSVMVQNWANVEYAYNLPGGSFVPPPEVEVGVVSLTPLRQPYIQLPYETVDYVVNSLFLPGKNKYLRTNLRRLFVPLGVSPEASKKLAKDLLEKCDIDPTFCAVRLSMDDIKSLCFGFQHLKETHPLLLKTQTSLEETIQNSEADYYNVEKTTSEADLKYVVQFD